MPDCGLCLQKVEGNAVTIKKYWEKGDDQAHYFYYHEECYRAAS